MLVRLRSPKSECRVRLWCPLFVLTIKPRTRTQKRNSVIGSGSHCNRRGHGKKRRGLIKHSLTSQLMDVLSAVNVNVSDARFCKLKSMCLNSLCVLNAIDFSKEITLESTANRKSYRRIKPSKKSFFFNKELIYLYAFKIYSIYGHIFESQDKIRL